MTEIIEEDKTAETEFNIVNTEEKERSMSFVDRITLRVKNALSHITKPVKTNEVDESTKPETPEDTKQIAMK